MDIAELEIFRAVAQEQSVTRAAKRLRRVQSNVTTRVRNLEEDLGAALFQRGGRRMVLTPEGQRLLDYAERILALAAEARQAVRDEAPRGPLRLGSMEAAAASRLPGVLASFNRKWPAVHIDIRTGTTQALADAVCAHRLDCAIVAHPDTGRPEQADMGRLGPELEGSYLFSEKLLLVAPPSHPRIRRARDVRVRNIAAFGQGCTYRNCVDEWLAQDGDSLDGWGIVEQGSYASILACVMAGTAVAAIPQSVFDMHPAAAGATTTFLRTVNSFLIRRAGFGTSAYKAFYGEMRRLAG
ncbi:LysR family transcriptional regulator [Bordetella bronchialis]|uniref:LysR family transcriptional regulator n=1 Tax=Bordetella bronchialis TaxID=463025 RepID=A0A193FZJ4_9BORD|nr:LysR family transcriptional regulator [Bordetella bronchialis]ANN69667.1 LysR family transcriptional regulator [Bordetella bronchialis]ANN72409.1 LysR family transcriptional regulator [Bordetella bronchialis]